MTNMNFTDWQDLWLKKDVEKISKSLILSTHFSVSIIANLAITTLTLTLTAISVVTQDKNYIHLIVVLAISSIIVPLLIFLIRFIYKKIRAKNKIIHKNMDIKEYVDKFDNKVCNSAMMADSLFEHMKAESNITAKYYCICEINYQINKCIDELYTMKSLESQIFVDAKEKENENENEKESKNEKHNENNNYVSPKRLRLVLRLLNNLRIQTYREMKNIDNAEKDLAVEEYINKEIELHDNKIMKFIGDFNSNRKPHILSDWKEVA